MTNHSFFGGSLIILRRTYSRVLLLHLLSTPTSTTSNCVFLHGFGASSSDWQILSTLPELKQNVKWIFPQAPLREITIANGEPIPAWFDILQMGHSNRNEEGTEDEPGMKDSLKDLDSLIDHELSLGVDVLVGGFSQGAGLSLLAGLTEGRAEKLKGLILLSGYLPLKWKILDMKDDAANELPVFWAHGTADTMIPFSTGEEASKTLKESGMKNIEFQSYKDMPHSYCLEELRDLQSWIVNRFPVSSSSRL